MKTFLGALTLALAVPAVAQTAPATDPQAGQHAPPRPLDHTPAKHDGKECCEKMKSKDGRMDCEKDVSAKPSASEQAHEGHAH